MSKIDKLIEKLKTVPTDFEYSEVKSLLSHLGYEEYSKGKTSGSRVLFMRKTDGKKIMLHKPHPQSTLKKYAASDLLNTLMQNGDLL